MGRGSKQTVYAHFHDKETLFREMVTAQVGRADDPVSPVAARLTETDTLKDDLRELAREHLALVMRPELIRRRRTLIGEAERFPDLASERYRRGPEQSATLFASWFERPGERGLLNLPDTQLAAQMFNWLVLPMPVNKAMAVVGNHPLYTRAQLDGYADEGVRIVLAAYGAWRLRAEHPDADHRPDTPSTGRSRTPSRACSPAPHLPPPEPLQLRHPRGQVTCARSWRM